MKTERSELKRRLHCARSNLAYRLKHATPEIIAATQSEVDRLTEEYAESDPTRATLRVRSPYFIGPRRARGVRGDGPTIICFRCEEEKARDQFYKKGTVCIACVVKRSTQWASRNKQRVTELKRKSSKEKKRKDPAFRAMLNCRNRLSKIIRGIGEKRGSHFSELIGITTRGFSNHIESLFSEGMSWDNYGSGKSKWVIDHAIPVVVFDHRILEERKKCWHYTNLQPMWFLDNQEKSDRLPCGSRARRKNKLLTT